MKLGEYPEILSPKHVQEILNWDKNSVYALFKNRRFPSEKQGRKHYIPKFRFLKWLGRDTEKEETYEQINSH